MVTIDKKQIVVLLEIVKEMKPLKPSKVLWGDEEDDNSEPSSQHNQFNQQQHDLLQHQNRAAPYHEHPHQKRRQDKLPQQKQQKQEKQPKQQQHHIEQQHQLPSTSETGSAVVSKLSASAVSFERAAQYNPQGGLLQSLTVETFERAHGLNGREREDNTALFHEINRKTNCSAMSFYRLLYGHSYQSLLKDVRAQLPNYPTKQKGVFYQTDYIAELDVSPLFA